MAIMAMATERKSNFFSTANVLTLLSMLSLPSMLIAGEWQLTPNLGIEETYTDNVELTITDPTASLVSQAIVGLDLAYESRMANLTFTGKNSNVFFSHDSELNDNYLTLDGNGLYSLWTNGPQLIANAKVDNTSRNSANNSLADLVSGDTIQSEYYSGGIQYNVANSTYRIESSVLYNINRFEDGIGEYNGVTATLNTQNGNNARITFWQLSSSFSTKNQDFSGETRTGEQYIVDAKAGLITPYNLNPFVRFYDEDISGNFTDQNQNTTPSWGPGIRWLISDHLLIDLSYNFVADETVSDDYIATNVQWEPSARTSLSAGYSQRFFGDSYNLDFKHRTKRLTNSITYNESLEVFDRDNYEEVDIGLFWCPTNVEIENITQCFVRDDQPNDAEYLLANFFKLEPIESNEFSLYKRFAWNSQLQLARTSFAINTFATRREGLESTIVDDTLGASLTIVRKISGKSSLTFLAKYDYLNFDKNNPLGSRQEDHYRTLSATYTKDLASSLSTFFTVQHVNRDSTVERYSYDEVRAIINVTKEF